MPARNVNLADHDDRFIEEAAKLATLRALASEAFDAIDRGEEIVVEGEREVRDHLGAIGRRAACSRRR